MPGKKSYWETNNNDLVSTFLKEKNPLLKKEKRTNKQGKNKKAVCGLWLSKYLVLPPFFLKKKRFVFLFKKMLLDPYFFEEAQDFFY